MAAPSVSGVSSAGVTVATFTTATLISPAVPANGTVSPIGGQYRIESTATDSSTVYGARHTFSSPVNFSGYYWIQGYQPTSNLTNYASAVDATTMAGIAIVVFDSGGNWASWNLSGSQREAPVNTYRSFVIDLASTSTRLASSGTLDVTSIAGFEIHMRSSANLGLSCRLSTVNKILNTGLTGVGGEVGNPLKLETYFTYATTLGSLLLPYLAGTDSVQGTYLVPVTISGDVNSFSGGQLSFYPRAYDGTLGQLEVHLDADDYGLFIDASTGSGTTIEFSNFLYRGSGKIAWGILLNGTASLDVSFTFISRFLSIDFAENSTWQTVVANKLGTIALNGATISGSFVNDLSENPSVVIDSLSNPAQLDLSVVAGDVQVNLAPGSYSTLRLALPDDQTVNITQGAGTYTLTGLTGGTVGNPIVFDNTGGGAVVVVVGAEIEAVVADPVTAGTLTIQSPTVNFSAPNLADGAIYQVLHRQTFTVAANAINTTDNTITLTTDSNGDAPDFDTSTANRHTLCRVILSSGATIPASTPQIQNAGSYRVASISLGAITLEVTEGGGAIDFTSQGVNGGGGMVLTLVFETLVVEGTVSGGSGFSQAIDLPDGAIYRFKAIHQDNSGGPRLSTRLVDVTGAWSATAGASFVGVVDVTDAASDLWTEANRIANLSNFELEDQVIDNAGNVITSVNPVEDGADIGGLAFLLEGRGFIQINAGAVTKNSVSVNGALSGQDLAMWAVYQLGILDNLYLASSTTVVLDGLSNAVIDNVELDETSGNLFQIYGMNIRERDGRPIVASTTTGPVVPNVATRGNVGLTSVGSGLDATQSTQLATLFNATTAGSGATVFSTTALANAPSGSGLDAAGVRSAIGLASANLDTQLGAINTGIDAILVDTDATIPALIGALPTVAEFEARTLPAADYFVVSDYTAPPDISGLLTASTYTASLPDNFGALGINASGHLSRVTLVDTTTTNTDMRGTDGALTTLGTNAPANWINADSIATDAVSEIQAGLATSASLPANFGDLTITATTGLVTTTNPGGGATAEQVWAYSGRSLDGAQAAILTDIIEDTGSTIPALIGALPTVAQVEAAGFTITRHNALLSAESAALAVADGRHVIDYANSTATQYEAAGTVRKVFGLYDSDGNLATSPETAVERRPI